MRELRIALLGAGTVGRGLIELIQNRAQALQGRTGTSIKIVAVADRSHERKSFLYNQEFHVSNDARAVIERDDVDVVVELIGGLEPAREWILHALRSGKHVVTANKALLANHGAEIFAQAHQAGVEIGFEAAVAGALPVIRNLRRVWVGSDMHEMFGILNGTCNFIITRMQKEDMAYEDALKIAQE